MSKSRADHRNARLKTRLEERNSNTAHFDDFVIDHKSRAVANAIVSSFFVRALGMR